jgi:hypothetical protein
MHSNSLPATAYLNPVRFGYIFFTTLIWNKKNIIFCKISPRYVYSIFVDPKTRRTNIRRPTSYIWQKFVDRHKMRQFFTSKMTIFQHMYIYIPGRQMFGSTNVWVDECLGQQMNGPTNVYVDEYLGWQIFGLTNIWVDKYSGWQIFGSINLQVDDILSYDVGRRIDGRWIFVGGFDKKT